jgi:predicted enzyme related to lactoylglutathione lyase
MVVYGHSFPTVQAMSSGSRKKLAFAPLPVCHSLAQNTSTWAFELFTIQVPSAIKFQEHFFAIQQNQNHMHGKTVKIASKNYQFGWERMSQLKFACAAAQQTIFFKSENS